MKVLSLLVFLFAFSAAAAETPAPAVDCKAFPSCGPDLPPCVGGAVCATVKGCNSALCLKEPCKTVCGKKEGECTIAESFPVQIGCGVVKQPAPPLKKPRSLPPGK